MKKRTWNKRPSVALFFDLEAEYYNFVQGVFDAAEDYDLNLFIFPARP